MYKGIGASAGIGIGKVVVLKEQELNYTKITIEDTSAEKKKLADAIEVFIEKTTALAETMKVTAGEKEAEILQGHILMLQDPMLQDSVEAKIDGDSMNVESAVEEACDEMAEMFRMIPDELIQQRASDLGDIKVRLIQILLGVEGVDISAVPAETILVAEDLTPSMTAEFVPENIEGVLTEIGGKTSHSAIICRSMEIPAVLSIPEITTILKDGDVVVLDGTTGEVHINPEESVLAEYKAKRDAYLEAKAALAKFVGKPSQTADGHVVELVANIGGPDEAQGVLDRDGEGVGLFRSEFLFMDSDSIPSEDSQFEAYKKVAETLAGKPVIIRTLDIGGDKALPYLGLPTEENPFLGFRAVRFCLKRQDDIYKPQLRALLRASAFGKVRIMVPLVTCVDELRAVKAIIEELKAELDAEGIAYDKNIEVGVMMETAAASLIADLLAKEADFFSIGTNDLTGYTMAADRGNPDVAYLYSAYNPAVLRSIRNIIGAANKEGIMAGMCGEAASDPLMIPLLLAFGLNEFSVSATAILQARKTMSLWTMDECKALADEVMQLTTEAEVKALLEAKARS